MKVYAPLFVFKTRVKRLLFPPPPFIIFSYEQKEKSMRIVVVVACLLIQLCVGILYLWSVFNNAVTEHFGWNARSASMVSSFMIFGFVLGNLIGGFCRTKPIPA